MSTSLQLIDLSYLDLMSDGDLDMKQMMLEMLLEEIPVEMEKMRDLEQEKDWNELREVSHKMKSTLAFVGNKEMTEANKTIEEIAKTEEGINELPTLLSVLLSLYPKVLEELKVVAESL